MPYPYLRIFQAHLHSWCSQRAIEPQWLIRHKPTSASSSDIPHSNLSAIHLAACPETVDKASALKSGSLSGADRQGPSKTASALFSFGETGMADTRLVLGGGTFSGFIIPRALSCAAKFAI